MNTIYPCLWFNGNAKEATDFYQAVFDDVAIHQCTPIVITFYIKGYQFMALNGRADFKPNPSVSFFTICKTEEEIERAYHLLKEGGRVFMPLNAYQWSNKYAFVQDKYGVTWQLSLAKENEKPEVFPSLMFSGVQNGNAFHAINFYTSLFEDSEVDIIAEYDENDSDVKGNIKYGQFKINNFKMSVMDSSIPEAFPFTQGVSFVVPCNSQEEIDLYWLNITEDGQESMCGWCQDSFGVWWQVVPSILGALMSDPNKTAKVSDAFLKMKKMDIATIEAAASQTNLV